MKSFHEFLILKEEASNNDWKKEFRSLAKGFIPPPKMKPVIEAFLKSAEVEVQHDTSKPLTMPKKSLYLTGGSVRNFLANQPVTDFHLVTNATPEQVAHILQNNGFKRKGGNQVKLTFEPEDATASDKRTWKIESADKKGQPYSVTAAVDGETFEIHSMRSDPKTQEVGEVNFVDNPVEDSKGRDASINAMYIELSKPDGENNKLYDPQGGYNDLETGNIRPIGDPEENFGADKARILRMIRMHSRYGKGKLGGSNPEDQRKVRSAMERYKGMNGVDPNRIRDEFMKGLSHPNSDLKKLISGFNDLGVGERVFGLKINGELPEMSDKRDKALLLAWLLQGNDGEKMASTDFPEKRAVAFLHKLNDFSPEMINDFLRERKGSGLSAEQIKDWVDMFNTKDTAGRVRNKRPEWARMIRVFADHQPSTTQSGIESMFGMGDPMEMVAHRDRQEIENFLKKLGPMTGI